jgi:hypothetical protein
MARDRQVHQFSFVSRPTEINVRFAGNGGSGPFRNPFSFAVLLSTERVATSGGVLWTISHGCLREWTDNGELTGFIPNTFPAAPSEDDFVFDGWVPRDPLWDALAERYDWGQWVALGVTALLVISVFVFLLIADVFKRKKRSGAGDQPNTAGQAHGSDDI